MVCLHCASPTQVINSRAQRRVNQVWRRRRCLVCKSVFTTSEKADWDASLVVQKTTNLEPFSRDKLYLSVYDSCRHRQDAAGDATALTATIMSKLAKQVRSAAVSADDITKTARAVLRNFDEAAAVHYAAFHPA